MVLPIAAMGLLLIWRHEGNIRKLLAGTESRLGQRAETPAPRPHAHPHKKGRSR